MAHLQGTDYVGSMVVMQDGLPDKREYRRFKVNVPGNDDYAAMEEVLTRRLTAYLALEGRPAARAGDDRPGEVPLSAAAAAGRRRQGSARRGRAGRAPARAGRPDPGGRPRQAVRAGLRAGAARAGRHPAGERGAVHAPAHPRRGPPLRQHVPRRAAQQADDEERARRHPWPRRDAVASGCSRRSAASARSSRRA